VDREFGTGALKVTPAHDINDYNLGIKHNLPGIDIFNDNGTLNENAEIFIGEDRFAVREKISRELEARGHLVKVEEITNSVGYSERTDEVIEPKLSMQWFLKMDAMAKGALEVVMDDTIKFHPPKFKNIYKHWMENVRDWCISRQLWWGHRIPAWYLPDGQIIVAMTGNSPAKAREQYGASMSGRKTCNRMKTYWIPGSPHGCGPFRCLTASTSLTTRRSGIIIRQTTWSPPPRSCFSGWPG
jgi:valyl-tRNA synthetase